MKSTKRSSKSVLVVAFCAALALGALTDRVYVVASLIFEADEYSVRKTPPGGNHRCVYMPATIYMGVRIPEDYLCAQEDIDRSNAMWRESEHLVRRFGHINRHPERLVAP